MALILIDADWCCLIADDADEQMSSQDRWADKQMSTWSDADADAYNDAVAVTPSSNTMSYSGRSVPLSFGYSGWS